jgi:hypothetical protein
MMLTEPQNFHLGGLGGIVIVFLFVSFLLVKAKDDALLRRWSFDKLRSYTAGNAQGIGGAWWFA